MSLALAADARLVRTVAAVRPQADASVHLCSGMACWMPFPDSESNVLRAQARLAAATLLARGGTSRPAEKLESVGPLKPADVWMGRWCKLSKGSSCKNNFSRPNNLKKITVDISPN